MARRLSESEHEKRRKRRVLIFSIFMIFLLVFSTFAYFLSSPSQSGTQLEYGEYEFWYAPRPQWGPDAQVLVTEFNGQEVEFQSLPIEVGYLNVSPEAIILLQQAGQVALSAPTNLSPDEGGTIDYVRLQIGLAIPKAFNAMSTDDEQYSLPVFTCKEATPQLPVVIFINTNETVGVAVDDSCIIVRGEGRRMMQLKDRIIFEYYGILQNGEIIDD